MTKLAASRLQLAVSKKLSPIYYLPSTNSGVVALVTSIIVGLLLVVITTGAVALMGSELRQASDFDQSVKAYFAAESGTEDAIAKIRRDLKDGKKLSELVSEDCDPYDADEANLSNDADRTVEYTCQVVSVATNQLTGKLRPEENIQVDLTGIGNFNKLVISWNQRGNQEDPQSASSAAWRSSDGQSIPTNFSKGSSWKDVFPAVLEATLIDYPKSSSFNEGDIKTRTIVLKPHPSGDADPLFNVATYTPPPSPPPGVQPANVKCVPAASSGSYDCKATLELPPGNSWWILRLQARYSHTNYQIQAFLGASPNPIEIPNGQLTIDVTGKATDVLRRVQVKAPISPQPAAGFALLANETICKVMKVSQVINQADTATGCDL